MKRKVQMTFLPLTLERNGDGFLARCPLIQGAFAEGDTASEAIFNCLDVIQMIFAYRKERGESPFEGPLEELPAKKEIAFTLPVEV
jgi:predicted RNase H-like HicB family nuclease